MDEYRLLLAHMVRSQLDWVAGRQVIRQQFDCDANLVRALMESQVGRAALSEYIAPPTDDAPSPPGAGVETDPPSAPKFSLVELLINSKKSLKSTEPASMSASSFDPKKLEDDVKSVIESGLKSKFKNFQNEDMDDSDDDDLFDFAVKNENVEEDTAAASSSSAAKKPQKAAAPDPVKKEVSLQSALSEKIKDAGHAQSKTTKEQVQEAMAVFQRFNEEFNYVWRVAFDPEVYGMDEHEHVVGPFSDGIYLQTDDSTGLHYFSVEANNKRYIIAAKVGFGIVEEVENYAYDGQAHSEYLVKYERITAEIIRKTAADLFKSFINNEKDPNERYNVIKTNQEMVFYNQDRRPVKFMNFVELGYNSKQDIYYYMAWLDNQTANKIHYVATKKMIAGNMAMSEKTKAKTGKPYATYYDAALIDVVAPTKKPTNARLRILLRCY